MVFYGPLLRLLLNRFERDVRFNLSHMHCYPAEIHVHAHGPLFYYCNVT
jgi:hypothetical protein